MAENPTGAFDKRKDLSAMLYPGNTKKDDCWELSDGQSARKSNSLEVLAMVLK